MEKIIMEFKGSEGAPTLIDCTDLISYVHLVYFVFFSDLKENSPVSENNPTPGCVNCEYYDQCLRFKASLGLPGKVDIMLG